jgi:hypothetical protein
MGGNLVELRGLRQGDARHKGDEGDARLLEGKCQAGSEWSVSLCVTPVGKPPWN